MTKRVTRIIFILIEILIIVKFANVTHAKYNYNIELKAFTVFRDTKLPNAKITYSTTEPTNKDVTVNINVDKDIIPLQNFNWNKENKVLSKVLSENTREKVILEDYSGNKNEIEYNVDWIDKIKPEIIGVEDNKTYTIPVKIDYKDNMGIKDIVVENYGYLKVEMNLLSYDTEKKYAFDYNNTTCKIRVLQKPKDATKLKFYYNDKLLAITTQNEYTYSKLPPDSENLKFRIVAIDKNGNALEELNLLGRTSTYKNIKVEKDNSGANVHLSGIESTEKDVLYFVWEYGKQSTTQKAYIVNIKNGEADLPFKINEFNNKKCQYIMHIYTRDAKENLSLANGVYIDIGKNYNSSLAEKEEEIKNPSDVRLLKQKGRYKILVTDLAGNTNQMTIRAK